MKFVCLGYSDAAAWGSMSKDEAASKMEACIAFGDDLRRGGHYLGGAPLRPANQGVTIRRRQGELAVTDGPYAETKEQLGGFLLFEARDLNHAIQLMAAHPGLDCGAFEIREVNEELQAMIEARHLEAQPA
jgi:hypothetical protein